MSIPRRNTLPPSVRIRAKQDFDRLFRGGVRASDTWMTLLGATNEERFARLGISVPRRYGNAVRRNRIKRLIREAFRTTRHDLPPGTDWIVIPRTGPEPTTDQLRTSLLGLAQRLARRLQPARDEQKPSATQQTSGSTAPAPADHQSAPMNGRPPGNS